MAFCGRQRYKVVLDTGANYNYISENTVKENNMHTKNISDSTAELVNGERVISNKEVYFQLKFQNDIDIIYKVRARVLPVMEPLIILGIEFLKEHRAKTDFENYIVELSNMKYENNTCE
ncbi:hypothetical protein DMUE_4712 [Dictyocoela muelleri]|nr:hypothetical protein DMUE_4712 [Dictyocoela muelleri]